MTEPTTSDDIVIQAETLQNLLVARATGGHESDADYFQLRRIFTSDPTLERLLPRFVQTCRNLTQFWEFIKHRFGRYHERRKFIWDEFRPLLEHLEKGAHHPSDDFVGDALQEFDSANVHAVWAKALERRSQDPEGAVTAARTLLETVCKHILDAESVPYTDKENLPKLYRMTAEKLNLAPSQHTESVFKQILGGCTAVVEGLGSLRNRLSDAHGQGARPVKPAPRHAELAVNLSGAMAMYLVQSHEARKEIGT
jgi:uncharacterized protein YfkK (UPF0435 family)